MTTNKPKPRFGDRRTDERPEVWVFGGTRLHSKGDKQYARMHAWIPLPADSERPEPLLFAATGSYTVGSEYVVQVSPSGNGEGVTLTSTPKYQGRHDDDQLRAYAEAHHRSAEITYWLAAQERADRRASALDEALRPLIELSKGLPSDQRDTFLAYIIRRVTTVW